MIKEALIAGRRLVARNWKYIFLLWGTNVLLALVLTVPIYSMLQDDLAHSLWSNKLALSLDYFWLMQFLNGNENVLSKLPALLFGIVGVNILIHKLFQGGLIAVFNNPKKNHISDFFYFGVKFWFRFMKLLVVVGLIFLIIFFIDSNLDSWSFYLTQKFNSVILDLIIRTLRYLILLFLIGTITLLSEYTQVYLAVNDSKNTWRGIREIFNFVRENFLLVFLTFLTVSIIGALGAVVYNIVAVFIPRSPFYFLILTFILQQMLIIFRLAITMLLYATEVFIYKDSIAEVINK